VRRTKCELESSQFGEPLLTETESPAITTARDRRQTFLAEIDMAAEKRIGMSETRRRPCSDIVEDVSKPRTWHLTVGLALFFGSMPRVAAQGAHVDPASLIGGSSTCPTPALVWQHVLPLVASPTLVDRIRSLGGPAPVQIIDLGPSFRVTVGGHVREYTEEARDCAKRAQFAAVFVAIAAGADPASATTHPPVSPLVDAVRASPTVVVAAPAVARVHLDLGATAGAALGGVDSMIAPGLSFRIAVGRRPFVPVVGLAVSGPYELDADGVGFRQWQATADVGVRAAARPIGRARGYGEIGAACEVLADRATTLSVARTQFSYAVGPRGAAGLLLATRGRLSPFFLIHVAWFPRAPELFALPAGDLGRAAAWNLGATAGASWGLF
jgi:hypothetical protein